jgi:hypothetical protein
MKEIDIELDRWIFNSIIRGRIRNLIVKVIQQAYDKGYRDGSTAGQ